MRILLLTPGTGHFFCGSCLRDNALARALHRLGHDVSLVPLYLPHFLEGDRDAFADTTVHMGGINMYLQQKSRIARHLPRFVHDWLDRPSLLRWASKRGNMTEAQDLGAMTVSMLRGELGHQRAEALRLAQWIRSIDPPDVVVLSNIMLTGVVHVLRDAVPAKFVATLQGEQPFLDALGDEHRPLAWDILRERTKELDAFMPVSATYGRLMRERLELDDEKIHVVHNGIDLEGHEVEPTPLGERRPRTIGYLARMCTDKGLHTLVDAFIELRRRPATRDVKLCAMGVCLREDEAYVDALRARLDSAGLRGDVLFERNVDRSRKLDVLRGLSVLSVPATYGESFGLYLLEAMASGVPVVQPRHGAFEEVLSETGGGILCEPDDADSLATAIESMLADESRAQSIADTGRDAVRERFTQDAMARGFLAACERALFAAGS
ncbi:MAG: glycosyltransferase family 4 protein [Planctomycetes bacterium]|nr:glycosyltransferase family 4 protein [Planctomycetota bacterium]MCB9890509.1 glycosyltransferase family 4 protein [Planctomycetota bacterium]MCB9917750.1 glycosyltransferase family 4 protein [Planctomycetota bacterium]